MNYKVLAPLLYENGQKAFSFSLLFAPGMDPWTPISQP